jgi:hypothetical protein
VEARSAGWGEEGSLFKHTRMMETTMTRPTKVTTTTRPTKATETTATRW